MSVAALALSLGLYGTFVLMAALSVPPHAEPPLAGLLPPRKGVFTALEHSWKKLPVKRKMTGLDGTSKIA